MKSDELILECENLDKRFGASHAVNDVSFSICKGDIFGLVGENGAGKSTLIKIIGGECTPDSGKTVYKGSEVKWKKSSDALKNKISIVHQEPLLISSLNGADNIFLKKEFTKSVIINEEKVMKEAQTLLEKYGLYPELDLSKKVSELTIDERFIVEILKALSYEPDILILDEPTASLPKETSERLLNLIRELSENENKTFIYISHKLEEAIDICNKVMVLRNGEKVGVLEKEDIEEDRLIQMMINQSYEHFYPPKSEVAGDTILQVENLNTATLTDVNIEVKSGEIVGLYGLMGAGMNDIAFSIFGINKNLQSGIISIEGKKINKIEISEMIDRGVFLIPPDKHRLGLFDSFSVAENITIAHLKYIFPSLLVIKKNEFPKAEAQAEKFNIKYGDIGQAIDELSGGNQQKIILARWLFRDCKVLILVDPTVGIDIGAKREIYNLLRGLTDQKKAVLIISSEINEIVGISDRIYTMRRGKITAELKQNEITQENILKNIL